MAKPYRYRDGFRIKWTDGYGKRQSEFHKTRADAVLALSRYLAEREEIKRGLRLGIPIPRKFNELCDYYLEVCSIRKARPRDDKTMIDRHLRAFFGHLYLNQIEEHVDEYQAAKHHLHRKTIHNHLTLLITMLRVAKKKRWLLAVPEIKKPRIHSDEEEYNYLRTKDEIARFLASAWVEGEHIYMLYATAVYTGMRQGELAGLRKDCVDLSKRIITVQKGFERLTKSKRLRHIPILNPLLPLLREWLLKTPGPFVFPSQAGTMLQDSARIFQETFHRVLDRAGFPKIERNKKIRRYIVFHDLRHTFASHYMMEGGSLFKLQRILGHQSPVMTNHYSHLAPNTFTEDYDRFGDVAPGKPAPIVELHSLTEKPLGQISSPLGPEKEDFNRTSIPPTLALSLSLANAERPKTKGEIEHEKESTDLQTSCGKMEYSTHNAVHDGPPQTDPALSVG